MVGNNEATCGPLMSLRRLSSWLRPSFSFPGTANVFEPNLREFSNKPLQYLTAGVVAPDVQYDPHFTEVILRASERVVLTNHDFRYSIKQNSAAAQGARG